MSSMLRPRSPINFSRVQKLDLLPEDQRSRRQRYLISLVANGDHNAFEALYADLSRALFVVAVEILIDDAEAEDVIQEVFLKIWHKAVTFDGTRGKVFNWAVRITKNKAIDRYRSRKQFLIFQANTTKSGEVAQCEAIQVTETMQREDAVELMTAVNCLPISQRRPIELAFLGGLTHAEVSATLSQPLGTVKAHIRRGLLALRERIQAWKYYGLSASPTDAVSKEEDCVKAVLTP